MNKKISPVICGVILAVVVAGGMWFISQSANLDRQKSEDKKVEHAAMDQQKKLMEERIGAQDHARSEKVADLKAQSQALRAKAFNREVYRSINGSQTITMISKDELELHASGTTFVCKYSRDGDTLRVVVQVLGTTQAQYYRFTSQGLEDNAGNVLLSPEYMISDDQFRRGNDYHDGRRVAKDLPEAAKWFRKAAERGHAAGQFNLGLMYDNGEGVEQNFVEALKWYRKSAEQGNASAENNIGWMYQHGNGVEQNFVEALKRYRMAVKQGSADGQKNLGWMYQNGVGVGKDLAEAEKWYREAAAQGNSDAQRLLKGLSAP